MHQHDPWLHLISCFQKNSSKSTSNHPKAILKKSVSSSTSCNSDVSIVESVNCVLSILIPTSPQDVVKVFSPPVGTCGKIWRSHIFTKWVGEKTPPRDATQKLVRRLTKSVWEFGNSSGFWLALLRWSWVVCFLTKYVISVQKIVNGSVGGWRGGTVYEHFEIHEYRYIILIYIYIRWYIMCFFIYSYYLYIPWPARPYQKLGFAMKHRVWHIHLWKHRVHLGNTVFWSNRPMQPILKDNLCQNQQQFDKNISTVSHQGEHWTPDILFPPFWIWFDMLVDFYVAWNLGKVFFQKKRWKRSGLWEKPVIPVFNP